MREAMHRLHGPDKPMAWIGLFHPTETQINDMAEVFNLHPLAVEDAIVAHQRPKLERYDETLFVVLRPAIYLDASETVQIGELHLFIGPDFVLTVRHSDRPKLAAVRERLESDPELLARGPEAVLYAMIDFVVDRYAPVVAGLENDIDEIENQVFESDPAVSRRIYELSREVAELQRATKPLLQIMKGLEAGFDKYGTDEELQRNLRDVADHATSVVERVDGFRANLADILTLNATLVAQTQNEEMRRLAEAGMEQSDEVKKISAWAAILFAPSLISGIYGMNFDEMPELHWAFGYPFAVVLMLVVCCLLFVVFRKRKWL
nr:magnesium and cobalt transport protein CorA [Flexivirga endophytica]